MAEAACIAVLALALCERAYVVEEPLVGPSSELRDRAGTEVVVGALDGPVLRWHCVLVYRTTGIVNFASHVASVLGAMLAVRARPHLLASVLHQFTAW